MPRGGGVPSAPLWWLRRRSQTRLLVGESALTSHSPSPTAIRLSSENVFSTSGPSLSPITQ